MSEVGPLEGALGGGGVSQQGGRRVAEGRSPCPSAALARAAAVAVGWAALGGALSGCASTPYRVLLGPAEAPGVVVFVDVSVFTATGPELLAHQDVTVEGDRIAAIAPTGQATPPGARLIRAPGATLLPGFVDAHAHITSPGAAPWQGDIDVDVEHNLHGWLYAGVTTVYDLGGDPGDLEEWQQEVEAGEVLGPRIFHAGIPITAPDSHPIPLTEELLPWPISALVSLIVPQIETPEGADEVIADYLEDEVDYVKLIADQIPSGSPQMDEARLRAAIKASHARGKKVFVHIGSADNAVAASRAGADVLAHGIWRGGVSPEQAREVAASGALVIFTLVGWEGVAAMAEGRFQPTALDREISPPALLDPVMGPLDKHLGPQDALTRMMKEVAENKARWAQNVQALRDAGVTFLVGTDSALPGVYIGGSYHEEMRLLCEAGVSPADVLLGATARAATILNKDAEFGTVEVGKVADLVLVQGNPLEDIKATRAIVHVMTRGRLLDRRVEQYSAAP